GLSFAIPVDVAMDVVEQLKSEGAVRRGWLGVVIQEVNKDLAESLGLERPAGALVAQIMADGPGDKGDLKVGDVILRLNGNDIIMSSDLPHAVGRLRPGSKATMDIIRDRKRQKLEQEIGALPDDNAQAMAPGTPSPHAPGTTDNRL